MLVSVFVVVATGAGAAADAAPYRSAETDFHSSSGPLAEASATGEADHTTGRLSFATSAVSLVPDVVPELPIGVARGYGQSHSWIFHDFAVSGGRYIVSITVSDAQGHQEVTGDGSSSQGLAIYAACTSACSGGTAWQPRGGTSLPTDPQTIMLTTSRLLAIEIPPGASATIDVGVVMGGTSLVKQHGSASSSGAGAITDISLIAI